MLDPACPALAFAPMEGVTDAPFRALAGEWGGFSYAVTEFLRVAQSVPSRAAVLRHAPELATGSRTVTGLPVQLQLLGGDPGRLAAAATVAVSAGAGAIDLNFGCPAKTVNRHDGGATLLKYPARVRAIVRAVRDALPPSVPVSAKLRLGWDSAEPLAENAAMAEQGGAAWVTVHARTRVAGYAPPVDWAALGKLRETLRIPLVANGDIWTLADFRACRAVTGCRHFMLGRGALADPGLPRAVAAELGLTPATDPTPIDWPRLMHALTAWTERLRGPEPNGTPRRVKQWLRYAAERGTFHAFDDIKRLTDLGELLAAIERIGHSPRTTPQIRSAASTSARTLTHAGIELGGDCSSLG